MTLVGHSYEAHLHNSKCSEDDIRWSQRFSFVLRRFHYILSVLRLFSQKTPKSPWVLQIWFRIFVPIFKVRGDLLHYLRWTRSFARKIWITYKLAHMTYHQNSSNQPDGPMVSTYLDLWYLRHIPLRLNKEGWRLVKTLGMGVWGSVFWANFVKTQHFCGKINHSNSTECFDAPTERQ